MAALRIAQSNPADSGSVDNTAEITLTPDGTIAAGDLVIARIPARNTGKTFTHSKQAGQTWQSTTVSNSVNSLSTQLFWCIYNGTWTGGTIGWTEPSADGSAISIALLAFSPTSGFAWTLTPDVAFALATPTAATLHTITGQTASARGVSVAFWSLAGQRTWSTLTGTWTYGHQQVRNLAGSDITESSAYIIQTSGGATGDVSNTASISTAAHTAIGTFIETAVDGQPTAIRGGGVQFMTNRSLFGRGF